MLLLRRPLACCGLALSLAGIASAQDGGIEVFAAEPLFAGGSRVSLSYIFESRGSLFAGSHEVADPLGRTARENRLVVGYDRGLSPNLSVSALVPLLTEELDSLAGDTESAGPGDVALIGKYRFHRRDWKRGTFNVAAVGGIEVPTGQTNEREGGVLLPPGSQPGRGAWNPFLSVSSNLSIGRYRLDASLFYKLNTEGAQEYEEGDFFAATVQGKYRFYHARYPGPTAGAKLGLQYRYQGRDERNGLRVTNSGGQELRGRAGITWHPAPNLDVSLTAELPLYRDFEGQQLALDFRSFLAFGLRF